jgi:PAS domain S-box-containing protein
LYSIQQSVGYDNGVVLLSDEDAGVMRRVAQVGMPLDVFEQSKANIVTVDDLEAMIDETAYQISESYFYPAEKSNQWGKIDLSALRTDFPGRRPLPDPVDNKSWHNNDLLLIPLTAPGGNLLGVISLDRPQDNQRPDRATMEILEIFSHQAAATIENIRLYLGSLQSAEQEARLNEMMEAITGTLNTEQIVEAVAYGALRLVPFTQMTVALQDAENRGFDLLKVEFSGDGSLVVTRDHQPYDESSTLLRTLRDGQDYVYHINTPEAQGYSDLSAWHARGERTTLIVPLFAGGKSIGAIHLGSDLEQAFGFNEFRALLKRMANLAAVAIENARLFNEALNLQAFNESVVESIQMGIVVLDKSGRILSINEFMIQRYGWDEETALRQDLFSYRPNLNEYLYDDVTAVLTTGRPHERIGQTSYHESGRMLVRNFYSYPLKTGDSIRGAVILVEDVTERHLLEKDLEKRANQLAVLTEVSSRITASLNREEVINLALDEIGRVIQNDTMTLWSRDGEILNLEGSNGFNDDVAMVADKDSHVKYAEHDRLNTVVEAQKPYSISRLQGWDALPGEDGAKSWLGVPLVNQGNVVGVIALARQEEHAFDAQAEQAAFAFANQVAIALANADLYTESQYRTERLSLLNRVSVALAQSLDSENILEVALQEIANTMRVPNARALVYYRDLNIGRVIVAHPRGDEPPDEIINLLESPTSQLLRRNVSPIIYEDVQALKKNDPIRQELSPRNIKAYALIPMVVGGQVIGAFELTVDSSPRFFQPEQIELALVIANQAAIAVQNTNLLETTLLRTRELETLLEAAQATSLTLDLNEAYRSVAELILHALDVDSCSVMIWDNVEGVLDVQLDASKYGSDEHSIPRGTQYNLRQYPSKLKSLEDREIIVIRASQGDSDPTELDEVRARGDSLRVLVPLVVRDQAIGLIQTGLQTPHRAFGHREMRLAQALGAQAAIAIQNARLSTETAALVEEGFIINNLSQAISSTLTIEDMVLIVRDQVPRVTDAEEMYLALYEPETQLISFPMAVRAGIDFEIPPRPLNTDEVSFIIKHRRSLSLGGGNWSSDDMRRNLSIANGEGDAHSYLGVPVASGDQVLGVLALRDTKRIRAFGINDERLLTTVGTQLGAAIQNARLFKQVSSFAEELNQRVKDRTLELQHERDRIDTLYRITSELARTLDMDRVLKRALEMVASAVLADDGVIMLIDPLSDRLTTRAALRTQYTENENETTEHPATNLATWVLQHARVVMVDDLRKEEYWDLSVPGADEYHSALAVLLETGDDPQGVMVLLSKTPNAFNEPQLKLVNAAANQVASAINNADLYHLIRDQAERLGKLLRQEQEEAEKNSAIVEGIADGVMLADSEGVIIQFNTAAERILDLERDQVIGQSLFKLTGLFGGSASQWAQAVEGWTADPESHPAGSFLAETLDLGTRVVSVHLSPVHIGERFLGTVSVFRDITKEVEVDRIKSEFVSNVSHELRTPMTSIKGFADLMLMGVAGQVSDPQKTFLVKIKSNADRLSQLVDDLLNISKIDAGEKLNVEWVDLNELIPSVVQNVQSRAENEKKDMNVTVDVQELLPTVQGDPHKITQIISSIVDNAFNYTYPGGNIIVTAKQQPDEKHILLTVQDTGIGIPEEFQSRIWGRFERFDDHALVMDVPGTGLGLSIVKELVQMHNGTIWFESELGQGTTFFVELPIEQPVEAEVSA